MSRLTDRAKKLKTDIPAVFLALKEKRTPWYAKIIAAVVVVYYESVRKPLIDLLMDRWKCPSNQLDGCFTYPKLLGIIANTCSHPS